MQPTPTLCRRAPLYSPPRSSRFFSFSSASVHNGHDVNRRDYAELQKQATRWPFARHLSYRTVLEALVGVLRTIINHPCGASLPRGPRRCVFLGRLSLLHIRRRQNYYNHVFARPNRLGLFSAFRALISVGFPGLTAVHMPTHLHDGYYRVRDRHPTKLTAHIHVYL